MQKLTSDKIGYLAGAYPLDPHKPTVLFIHGSAATNIFWEAQVAGLGPVANTVAIDLPGHGTSPGPSLDDIPAYADAVMAFIDRMDIPDPIPSGLSLGGAVALQMLIDNPGRFRAGILMNTGARLKVNSAIFEVIDKSYDDFMDFIIASAISEKCDEDRVVPFVKAAMQCTPEVAQGDFRACNRFDVMDKLAVIDASILVLTGSDDKLTPMKYGKFMADGLQHAQLKTIADAGHFSPIEKPWEVNAAIEAFIKGLA